MRRILSGRFVFLLLFASLCIAFLSAQEQSQPPAQSAAQSAEQKTQQQPTNPDTAVGRELSTASEKALHAEEGEAHEEGAEFKYSSMVQRLGRMIGLDGHGMYWLSLVVNFLILGLFFWMLLKARLPQMFRERTNTIQKALKEAHAASAACRRDYERRPCTMQASFRPVADSGRVANFRGGTHRNSRMDRLISPAVHSAA